MSYLYFVFYKAFKILRIDFLAKENHFVFYRRSVRNNRVFFNEIDRQFCYNDCYRAPKDDRVSKLFSIIWSSQHIGFYHDNITYQHCILVNKTVYVLISKKINEDNYFLDSQRNFF